MLTVNQTNWREVTAVSTTSSKNVVFKFQGNGGANDVLWIKGAPGLTRVEFANKAMERLGFTGQGNRIIRLSDAEYTIVVNKIADLGRNNRDCQNKLQTLRNERHDLIVMENAGTTMYGSHLEGMGDQASQAAEHLRIFGEASIQQDVARIIAADLLLGNFDRLGASAKAARLHPGNFLIDLSAGARFIPIDNDVVAPSLQHVITKADRPATQEQLYAVVIHGGILKNDNKAFPSPDQSSMAGLLGANAADMIYEILNEIMPAVGYRQADNYAQERQQLRQYAGQIAPLVRDAMRDLLAELKNPGGQREGLNKLMKAQKNIEGMNYDTFKLKSRFAALMLDAQNLDPQEVDRRAQGYQQYRTWKLSLNRLFERVVPYPLPGDYNRASYHHLVGRGVDKFRDKNQMTANIDEAHTLKKDVRKGRLDETQLRQEWNNIKSKPDTEQAVVKAKLVCIAKLYGYDLQTRTALLQEVTAKMQAGQNWVDEFYLKTIRKRQMDLPQIVEDFRTNLNDLRERLKTGGCLDEHRELIKTFRTFEAAVRARPIY